MVIRVEENRQTTNLPPQGDRKNSIRTAHQPAQMEELHFIILMPIKETQLRDRHVVHRFFYTL